MPVAPEVATRLREAFAQGDGHGLLQLGAEEVETALPAVFAYWRDLAARFVTAACGRPDSGGSAAREPVPLPPPDVLSSLTAAAPPMTGSEYLSAEVLAAEWRALDAALSSELAASGQSLQAFLHDRHPGWSVVGRVHFNLAEYRLDPETPFAFLATYTTVAVITGQGAAFAARARARRVFGRQEPGPAPVAARPGPARRGVVRLAEEDGGRRRRLSSAPVDRRRGVSVPAGCSVAGGGGRDRAAAGGLAERPAVAPAGDRDDRDQDALGRRHGSAARFRYGRHAGWRPAHRRRDQRAAVGRRRLEVPARSMGGSPARDAPEDDRRIRAARADGRRAWHHLRGSDAARRRRIARRRRRHGRRGAGVVAGLRRAVASRRARGPAWPRGPGPFRNGRPAARDAPPVSRRRRALAALVVVARARRLPGRRHGPRQNAAGPRTARRQSAPRR